MRTRIIIGGVVSLAHSQKVTFKLSPEQQEETKPGLAFLHVEVNQYFQEKMMNSSGWSLVDNVQMVGDEFQGQTGATSFGD